MGDLNVKTTSTTEGRSIGDEIKEMWGIEELERTKKIMKKAIGVVDRFINRREDVYHGKGTREDSFRLKTFGFDPYIGCGGGYVFDPRILGTSVSVYVRNDPFSEKEGWDQYNAEIPPVEEVRKELVDKLRALCGAELFADYDVEGL